MHFFRDFGVYLAWLAIAGALICGQIAAFDGMFDGPQYELAVR